jgi:transcriptional regulator with XRE-family HTH domain
MVLKPFGEALTDLLKDRGWNIPMLARKTGLHKATLYGYVHQRNVPSIYVAYDIATALNCSLEDLLGIPSSTADSAEVRHGEWVEEARYTAPNLLYIGLVCSVCDFSIAKKIHLDDEGNIIADHDYKYCPDCGAKMDAERREK